LFNTHLSFSSDTLLNCRSFLSRTLRGFWYGVKKSFGFFMFWDGEKAFGFFHVLRWEKRNLYLILLNKQYSPLHISDFNVTPITCIIYVDCWIMTKRTTKRAKYICPTSISWSLYIIIYYYILLCNICWTRLTYNCAHLRLTKESLTFEYFDISFL